MSKGKKSYKDVDMELAIRLREQRLSFEKIGQREEFGVSRKLMRKWINKYMKEKKKKKKNGKKKKKRAEYRQ